MKFLVDLERINLMIFNGQLEVASAELEALRPQSSTSVEHRALEHLSALVIFHLGQILEAKNKMQSALDEHGENVNLLRDLIVCQYHLQDMTGFRSNLLKLEQRLLELQSQLSNRSLLECERMVGKFLEEEARLGPARDFYLKALSRSATAEQRLSTLIQLARWQALYEPNEELSVFYRELISTPRTSLHQDLRIELEHSLMLIELRLIGADHAWQRFLRLGAEVPEIDQRLLYFDFLEGLFTLDLKVSEVALKHLEKFDNLDSYEGFLKRLAQNEMEADKKIHELAVLAPQLPWASYLRLLCLSANVEVQTAARQELNRKIQLIIRGLDGRSQKLWNQRLKQALQSPEIRVEYSPRSRSVVIQGRHLDLSKKKMGMQLLEGLSRKPDLTVDEAILLLWQASFSPEHYHRLRMGIHRLNTLINKVTGLGKIIEVDSQNVRLRPEVRIRHSDDVMSSQSLLQI